MELIYIELPKVDLAELKKTHPLHPLRDWLNFLKNAPMWDKLPTEIKNPNVRKAATIARQSNLTKKEYLAMSNRQLYHWDQLNMITHATEKGKLEGKREGKRQGKRQGKLEGKQEEKLAIARALLDAGSDVAFIQKTTGLSAEELADLQGKQKLAAKPASPKKKRRILNPES